MFRRRIGGYLICAGLYGRQSPWVCFQPLNLASALIDPVAIDYWTRIGVSAAFGSVIFAENKLKISVVYFLSAVRDTIE